jgi:hypothetical protein
LILSDGTIVFFAPELSSQVINAVPVAARVTVTANGWQRIGPGGNRLLDAQTITNRRTGATLNVAILPPSPPQ